MFEQLEDQIKNYQIEQPKCKIRYQIFDYESFQPLIIAIVTPLMIRIHAQVKK